MNTKHILLVCSFFLLGGCNPVAPPESSTSDTESNPQVPVAASSQIEIPEGLKTLYVSPSGKDTHEGSKDAPLATLAAAIKKISDTEGGKVILEEGVYREKIMISGEDVNVAPLWIVAEKGKRVVFDGGTKITKWERDATYPDLFIVDAPHRESMFGATQYFDVWENTDRVRYRKVADPQGVKAWEGSVFPLDANRLLIHVRGNKTPEEADLWHNQSADGGSISRPHTVLYGLSFQNFLGGSEARALTVTKGRDIKIIRCDFTNNSMGISNSAHDTLVEDCLFTEVGMGVRHAGNGTDMVIRRSIFQSASGLFAFSDRGEHVRDAIRIYHAGNGATVEQCVTAGFWAGLYIKTISGMEGSRPYYVSNNTFIDTFRSGADHKQPRTFIKRNIIGPYVESSGVGPNGIYLRDMGATMEENYYFGHTGEATGSDRSGPEPFVDLVAGNLNLREDLPLPVPADKLGATERRIVQWEPRLAKTFLHQQKAEEKFAITQQPIVSASTEGALISIALSRQADTQLFYRQQGESSWKSQKGLLNQVSRPESMAASAPIEPEVLSSWNYLFVLLNGRLEPHQTYEFRIEVSDNKDKIETPIAQFTTSGDVKTLYVSASASEQNADGSASQPFSHIQDALNRALPGDTIEIAAGVYTKPLLLQHGGVKGKPLSIRGSGLRETILDGGKEVGTMWDLRNAPYVHVSDLQIRWFANCGLSAQDSPYGQAERIWIWNANLFPRESGISGQGLQLESSPGWTVSYSLFNRVENGILAIHSPRGHFHHNTTLGNLYQGISLYQSSRDTVVTHNSLTFTGNYPIVIVEDQPEAFQTLIADYNNYGSVLRDNVKALPDSQGEGWAVRTLRPEHEFVPASHYKQLITESKFIVRAKLAGYTKDWEVFPQLNGWVERTGKDVHSIYADPLYVDPIHADFRLLPGTPNQLSDGEIIGAFGVATKEQTK